MTPFVVSYQRSDRDFAIYMNLEYAGTITKIGHEWVCTHTLERFANRRAAEEFLISRVTA